MTTIYGTRGIESTVTGNDLGTEGQITVIRRTIKYDELVFDNEEQFNEWKKMSNLDCDQREEFEEFNSENFVDIYFDTTDFDCPTYVAIQEDQTSATDDWIASGIFDTHSRDSYELNKLKIYKNSWCDYIQGN